jgi:uncharacterized protein YcnI
MKSIPRTAAAAAFCIAMTSAASSHVDLVNDQAATGSEFVATFQVPHGCSGAATTALRIQVPAGIYNVKPMPKPGWMLAIKTGAYPKPFANGGVTLSQGVTEIDWTGGNLPDSEYDQFTLYLTVADSVAKGSTIYFPTVQECAKGAVVRWIEIPEPGKDAESYDTPAPGLKIAP